MNAESRTPNPEHGSHPANTVAHRADALRRCHTSTLRAADLVESGEPILAVETLHYVAAELEDMLEADTPPTLDVLIALEPRLGGVLAEARAIQSPGWRDYSRMKHEVCELVGWDVDHPILRTSDAYEVAIRALVEELRL